MPLLTLGSFILVTVLVALGTWLLTRRDRHDTSTGYFLGGRSLTAGYIAGSLLLTNLSTEQLVGLNGAAFADGLSVMAWEVLAGLSLVVMALFFLPRYLKSGIATVPQFLAERYAPSTRTITTVIFIAAYAVILLPLVLFTGATGLRDILDLPALTGIQSETTLRWLTVWLIGIIGSIYAIFGGLRSVAISDTLNGFGLLVGGLLITYLGLMKIDPDMFVALGELKAAAPEKFNSLGGPEQSVPWHTLFTGVLLLNLFYWCTNQQIIQRAFAAPSLAEGQKGVLLAGFFKVLAPLILVLPGIIAFHLYRDQISEANFAYGTLVKNVLPAPLAGFFAAVMFGAILSSFNSALNSTATLFSLGIYRDLLRPDAPERSVITSGKVFGCLIAVTSMTIAPFLAGQTAIFDYLQTMNAIYFIPIFSVVLVGMLSKRVPTVAANVALVGGVLGMLAIYFVPALSDRILGNGTPEFPGMIHKFHFLGVVFVTLIGLMLLIGAIAPRATPWVQRDAKEVDLTPWRWALPAGLGLAFVVLAIYLSCADLSSLR